MPKISNIIDLLRTSNEVRVSDLNKSIELATESLKLSREINNQELIGKSLNQLALYHMIQGNHQICLQLSEQAMHIFKELNNELGIADAKYSIASVYYKTDNYQLGLINLIDCLTIYKKHNDYFKIARTQKSIGTIYEFFGDEKNAIKAYEDSISSALEIADRNLESNAYNPLSGIYLDQHDVQKAYELIRKSVTIKRETGDIRGLAFALYGRGKVYFKLNDLEKAELDFKEAIRIHSEMKERLGIGMAYYKIAQLYLHANKPKELLENIELALEISKVYNIKMIKYKCYLILYQYHKNENNLSLALENLEKYLEEKEQVINAKTLKIIENYELIKTMEALQRENEMQRERAEILAKTERAEQLAKVKQDFLSTMSHEIRTPLHAVISIAHLLKDNSDERNNQLISSLNFASQNLLRIINDILDFTKLDAGKVINEIKPQNLKQLLENIRNTFAQLAEEKNISLVLNFDNKLSSNYLMDSTKFTQILGNLISNSIKYTNEGSVSINVSFISTIDQQDLIKFAVNDTGVGIAPQNLTEIFDTFSQPQSVTTRTQGGTGLGLAIVKKLVSLMDSEIKVQSEINKGSTFSFDVWLKQSNISILESIRDVAILKGKKILIVDDNSINALVATRIIDKWGLDSDYAEDGLIAIQKTSVTKYDFILMDIHMPNLDGYEASEIIRNSVNPNTKTPIFALTADITAEQSESKHNFNGFLLKPIDLEQLKEALLTKV